MAVAKYVRIGARGKSGKEAAGRLLSRTRQELAEVVQVTAKGDEGARAAAVEERAQQVKNGQTTGSRADERGGQEAPSG